MLLVQGVHCGLGHSQLGGNALAPSACDSSEHNPSRNGTRLCSQLDEELHAPLRCHSTDPSRSRTRFSTLRCRNYSRAASLCLALCSRGGGDRGLGGMDVFSPRIGSSAKQSALLQRQVNRPGTSLIIVCNLVHPGTHRIASHRTRIERLQQVAQFLNVLHSRIEPQVVVCWIEDYGHPVVYRTRHSVWRGC